MKIKKNELRFTPYTWGFTFGTWADEEIGRVIKLHLLCLTWTLLLK